MTPCPEQAETIERQSCEKWRGQGVNPRKRFRRCSETIEPCSEMLTSNFQSCSRSLPVGLLRNGHKEHLRPIRLPCATIMLANTCAFDSVMQVLCTSYCDSDSFRHLVTRKIGTCDIADLINNIVSEHCITRKTCTD